MTMQPLDKSEFDAWDQFVGQTPPLLDHVRREAFRYLRYHRHRQWISQA